MILYIGEVAYTLTSVKSLVCPIDDNGSSEGTRYNQYSRYELIDYY